MPNPIPAAVRGWLFVAGLIVGIFSTVLGPLIIAWRERGAIPLLAKWLATVMLAVSSAGSGWYLSGGWRYLPAVISVVVLAWMWSRPSR